MRRNCTRSLVAPAPVSHGSLQLVALLAISGTSLGLCHYLSGRIVDDVSENYHLYDSALGRRTFANKCHACHSGLAPDLRGVALAAARDREKRRYIVESILYPESVIVDSPGLAKKLVMPRMSLTNAELGAVVRFMIDHPDELDLK